MSNKKVQVHSTINLRNNVLFSDQCQGHFCLVSNVLEEIQRERNTIEIVYK